MIDVYGSVFKHALFPAWERLVRRRPTLEHLRFLERSQWFSLETLERWQTIELQHMLDHAFANVPFYAQRFREVGVLPRHIHSVADLVQLPVLTREDAQESLQTLQALSPPLPKIHKSTSGSTGQPLSFSYDEGSEYWRQAVKLRGYGWAGYEPGTPVIHFWGSLDALYQKGVKQRFKVAIDRRLKRERYVDSNRRTEASLAELVELIERTKPRALICFSQAAAALARHVNERGVRSWGTIPVICGAEKLYPADRQAVSQAFGPAVYETYGSREFMLIASECESHSGMHLSMENLIVEVVVPDGASYRPAAYGEIGEVAVTDLHNYGAPFIRYLTGDRGVLEVPGRCSCGRVLSKLRRVEGRTNDTLVDAGGNVVDSLFLNVLFSVLGDKVRQFQAVQHGDRSVDLRIVPAPAFDDRLLTDVRKKCQVYLNGVDLRTHVVDHIPPGKNGKLRVVVVEQ